VVSTKADLHAGVEADFCVSAVTGLGVEEWLEEVLSCRRVAGARLLDVDYDRYAASEAELGWVNIHANLRAEASPACVVGPLLEAIESAAPEIAHLKVFDRAASGWVKASLCANGQGPAPEGDLLADMAGEHEVVVNLRAVGDPEVLRATVMSALARLGAVEIRYANAFRPSYPRPEHRFTTAPR